MASKREQRRIDRYRETEARWLQRVLFAFGKAREARAKLTEATGEELNPLISLEDGTQLSLDTLEEIIAGRVRDLNETLGRGIHGFKR